MKKACSVYVASISLLLVGFVPLILAQDGARDMTGAIVTMYALDPVTAHLSLRDGKPGTVFQDHVAKNRDSHIAFNTYNKDSFRVGVQGSDRGVILDLGTDVELRSRYEFADTVGNSQGFASIHVEQGRALIGKDYRTGQFQPLKEFEDLARAREDMEVAPVVLGHIYLVRIHSLGKESMYAKLKVLAFVPGESVTIRWVRL